MALVLNAESYPHPTDQVSPAKDARELFLPLDGKLFFDDSLPENPREYPTYDLHIGTYASPRAEHRVGVYRPRDFVPGESPVVVLGVPWLVGNRGHIHDVANEFAEDGAGVVVKGTPRYAGPRRHALTFTEDANEIHGLIREVERTDMLGNLGKIRFYGESQAAGKLYVALATAALYDRDVLDALAIAPCPDKPITRRDVPGMLPQLASEGVDLIRIGKRLGLSGIIKLHGTFSLKDAHHHAAVGPVLASGEPGEVVPYISPSQNWLVMFGERDRQCRPLEAEARLKATLPSVRTLMVPKMGHLAVIKSEEARQKRAELIAA